MSVAIDTAAAVRELEATGIDHAQAEAIVSVVARAQSDLATKADIVALHAELAALKSDIGAMLSDVRADVVTAVGEAKIEIANVRWQAILAALAIAGVLFAALKLF